MKIIAELGSNWHKESDLFDAILMAKEDGATAIKYQHFTSEELFGKTIEQINEYSIKIDVLRRLREACDVHKIEFMCTAFSPDGYARVNPLVRTHKVASSEANWVGLLCQVFQYGKDVCVSTGGLSLSKVNAIVRDWRQCESIGGLCLMWCDPSYPSKKDVSCILEGVSALRVQGVDVGVSDHSQILDLGQDILGRIRVVEKHYNPFRYDDTPDHPHSLGRVTFKEFAKNCRKAHTFYTYNPHKRRWIDGRMLRPY